MQTYYPEIRVKLDDGAFLPARAHDTDAGADVFAPDDFTVPACEWYPDGRAKVGSATVPTGVHVELPENTACMLKSKSGLNVKSGIISEGVIDQGYDGEIVAKLYNLGNTPHRFSRGDKITQLVIVPVCYPTYVEADEIGAGERGSDGFGSTGRGL